MSQRSIFLSSVSLSALALLLSSSQAWGQAVPLAAAVPTYIATVTASPASTPPTAVPSVEPTITPTATPTGPVLRCDANGFCSKKGGGKLCSQSDHEGSPCPHFRCEGDVCAEGEPDSEHPGCQRDDDCIKRCSLDGKSCARNANGSNTGKACGTATDCVTKKCEGLQCQVLGHGKICSSPSSNYPNECKQKRCSSDGVCTVDANGTGKTCNNEKDCKVYACDTTPGHAGECVLGGGGASCSPPPPPPPGNPPPQNPACQQLACNAENVCVKGGGGKSCSSEFGVCDVYRCQNGSCVPNGSSSISCEKDSEAEDCRKQRKCLLDECTTSAANGQQCTRGSECIERRCANGICQNPQNPGMGMNCDPNRDPNDPNIDCAGKHCQNGECVPGGNQNAQCEAPAECKHKVCDNLTCRDQNGPGQNECANNPDCAKLVCVSGTCTLKPGAAQDPACTSRGQSCHLACIHDICTFQQNAANDPRCNGGVNGQQCGGLQCQNGRCVFAPGAAQDPRCKGKNPGDICVQPSPTPLPQWDERASLSTSDQETIVPAENQPPPVSQDQALVILKPVLKSNPALGSSRAKVTVTFHQDQTCGMCAYSIKNIISRFIDDGYIQSGLVRVVFVENPLGFWTNAVSFARAAKCAGEQDRYYPFVEKVYNTPHADSASMSIYVKELGLNEAKFDSCYKSEETLQAVKRDYEIGQKLGINGTPEWFVNGRQIIGAKPYETFKSMIDEEIVATMLQPGRQL